MAKYCQSITNLLPGVATAGIILLFSGMALSALLRVGSWTANLTQLLSPYFIHLIRFTLWQALLSTLLSIGFALLLTGALFRARFYGKKLLLRLYTVTFVLPTLIVILGILAVYGRDGWLAQLANYLGLSFNFTPYGLLGILFAHVFYNFPLALRLFLQLLSNIPTEQRQLAHQLNFTPWQHFRWITWPVLKKGVLPSASLIFTLCFSSFAVVLILGGSPKYSTLEVAIYQAIRNFNLNSAALLSIIQVFFCVCFTWIGQRLIQPVPLGSTNRRTTWHAPYSYPFIKLYDTVLIVLSALFLLPPLVAILYNGLVHLTTAFLLHPLFWIALWTSIKVACCAALLSVTFTLLLLWSARYLKQQYMLGEQLLLISGLVILVIPSMTLATGLFILFNTSIGIPHSIFYLVVFCNALMAIPFNLRILTTPFYTHGDRYTLLCQSLNISGLTRIYQIELKGLRRPIGLALAFTAILSIGDFGIIAILGNNHFITLPFYLFQLMGSYQQQAAATTGALLLLLCFALFTLIERLSYDD